MNLLSFVINNVFTSRPKRKPLSTAKAAPPKRKARLHVTDTNSEEENNWSPPLLQRKRFAN